LWMLSQIELIADHSIPNFCPVSCKILEASLKPRASAGIRWSSENDRWKTIIQSETPKYQVEPRPSG